MACDTGPASGLARRLARDAEAVCRYYLSNGRREGRYWIVGDVRNNPGRSLYVRLSGPDSGKGAAGKWTDAATGEHGDLLDLIALSCGLSAFRDVADEARSFLRLPRPAWIPPAKTRDPATTNDRNPSRAARKLFAASRPIAGTLAESYLRARGIILLGESALRFHPNCFYRDLERDRLLSFPALIACVTDAAHNVTGVHRTWLDPHGDGKARVGTPRRALGHLLGNAVRFGFGRDREDAVIAAGEGIETMLSLRMAMPAMPMVAGLSANHLAAFLVPAGTRRLYVAADGDGAGRHGLNGLSLRAQQGGIEVLALKSRLNDFNEDLRHLGLQALKAHLRPQLAPGDAEEFLSAS